MSTAARLVAEARRRRGLTQRALAHDSGVPQASIARIERGTVVPRADTLERLLRACGLTLAALPADGGIDRSAIRERLAMTPAERGRLGVQEANAMRTLTRGRMRRARH